MPAFERVGVADYKCSEKGCAATCLRQGGDAEIQESIDCCRGQIAHYKVLRSVRFVSEFPMTVTGKMQKYRIREWMETELGLVCERAA